LCRTLIAGGWAAGLTMKKDSEEATQFNKYMSRKCFKMELVEGTELVGRYGFPKLQRTSAIPHDLVPFNMALTEKKPQNKWVHFFIDDYQFERVWNFPERYLGVLSKFEGVITPDFSMYTDMPKAQQIWNCYRSRALAYFFQRKGIQIVPCASWSDAESFAWCFDGLTKGTTVSISSNGCAASRVAAYYFRKGYSEMCSQIRPSGIAVYGKMPDELQGDHVFCFESYCQSMKKRI